MKPFALAAFLLVLSLASMAQSSDPGSGKGAAKEPVDSGAIIMPPDITDPKAAPKESTGSGTVVVPPIVDPGAVKKPPENIDPGIKAPIAKETRPTVPGRKQSKDASCKGPDALCKQTSPR